jgi:hypothetical protein
MASRGSTGVGVPATGVGLEVGEAGVHPLTSGTLSVASSVVAHPLARNSRRVSLEWAFLARIIRPFLRLANTVIAWHPLYARIARAVNRHCFCKSVGTLSSFQPQ